MLNFKAVKTWLKRQVRYIQKSKTQFFNFSLMVVGLLEANVQEFRELFPPAYFGFVIVAIGVIGWYLRKITTESLDKKVGDV